MNDCADVNMRGPCGCARRVPITCVGSASWATLSAVLSGGRGCIQPCRRNPENGVAAATLRFAYAAYAAYAVYHPRLRSHAASVVRYPYAFASLERNDDMQPTS